jgi:hypothetical protein
VVCIRERPSGWAAHDVPRAWSSGFIHRPGGIRSATRSRTTFGVLGVLGGGYRGCRFAHPRLISVTPIGVDVRPWPHGAGGGVAGARTSVSARWALTQEPTWPGAQNTHDGEGEPLCEPPLRVQPKTTVTWAHTTRRGSPDLCVRPLGAHPRTHVARGPVHA